MTKLGKALIFILFSFFSLSVLAQNARLRVEVINIKSTEGNLKLGVFDRMHNYRTKTNPLLKQKQEVTDTVVYCNFADVPLGRYAIAVYHDENADDTLNTKKLGIPIEGIGFSGKFNSRIKPPDYNLASFRLKNDTTIRIKLKYNSKSLKK